MLKIGIPYRYIDSDILDYLRSCGFKLAARSERKYTINCSSPRCTIYLVNSTLLPELIEEGRLDLAILPSVDFREANTFTKQLAELDMPVGRLMLGVSKQLPVVPLNELPIKTVLTRTPRLTKEFLEKNRLKWRMRVMRGMTFSSYPLFGKDYAVVEYVRSGRTMNLNGLVPVATVTSSSVVMIAHPKKVHAPEISKVKRLIVSAKIGRHHAKDGLLIYSKPVAPVIGK